ncbi:hypothetical protein J2T02_005248 [Chitinophaga terrae (ex Kim and Jung 2007)]|uniref:S41 family peptidase n=1 Tax=Chitinophaga terrae (ex Kim and Jung 2007) TaxID=408074 RepID=UPI00278020C2|nr:S41 family peptidase [Chitinophaga terrae (ex Kim and Jung 2007)]MDQ0110099.1 hypothetical protein [Chitinophaga terrae (ex Kim and Jung 2007)]
MYKRLLSPGIKCLLAACICAGIVVGCRKDNKNTGPSGNNNNNGKDTAAIKEDSLRYLMYQIMQVTYADGGRTPDKGLPMYYWYAQVPSINPFDTKYANADSLLEAMKRYAINPATKAPYDRYSFLDRTGDLTNRLQNGISAKLIMATSGDNGIQYAPVLDDTDPNKIRLFVLYADKNSPAGQKGVTRGWEITGVNGVTSFTNTNSSLSYVYNSIVGASSVTLQFRRPDNSSVTYSLDKASYHINPVLFDTVMNVTVNNIQQKVGYFVFYTFADTYDTKGTPTTTKIELDKVFTKFKAAGIKNLVVDLRYNGGGSTNTAEYLDSAIAPASAGGRIMYNYLYNDKLTQHLSTVGLPPSVSFPAQTGGLNLANVFFIVSRNTASASELTLNNLKPYMNVKLVGDSTYGKPVGFIGFNISMYDENHKEKYLADLYSINFETTNANKEGGYYTGIGPDAKAVDYVNLPWGNAGDQNLKQVISYIQSNKFITAFPNGRLAREAGTELLSPISKATPLSTFNGMVDFRLGKRIVGGR